MVPFNYISVLIMPTDYCNMNCIYCFNDSRTKNIQSKMSLVTLKKVFEVIIPYYDSVTFIWHGGEPTGMGVQFYEKVILYQQDLVRQKEKIGTSCKIKNIMQSNLTLLDDYFVDFLIKNNFSIGGSYDGINNELTRGCSSAILKGHDLLVEKGAKNSLINVVSKHNIDSLIADYEWYKKNNISYTTNVYISSELERDDLYISPEMYVERFESFFQYWIHDTECTIHVRFFETILKHIIFNHNSMCSYTSCLGKWIGVHYNGDITPCNRSFPKRYWFGNVWDYSNIKQCFESDGFKLLTTEAVLRRNKCKECTIYSFCAGGCNNNAYVFGGVENNNHYYCKILIPLYEYIRSIVVEVMKLSGEAREVYNPILVNMISDLEEVGK